MNLRMWKRLCEAKGRLPLLKKTDVNLQTLAGEAIPIVGSAVASVCGKLLLFYVYDNLKHDLLLGDDALRTLNARIDYKKGLVWFDSQSLRFRRLPDDGDKLCVSAVVDMYRKSIPSVFGESIGDGGHVGVAMTIDTAGAHPIKQRPYRLPLTKRAVVDREIADMLDKGIIRPSHSPWASPITLVPKPDGSVRFCVDYRKLNAVTVGDCHPLPHIQDIFDALQGSSIFSTIDLRSGYWQIPMAESDIPKTAFVTHRGLYEFTRMPFGLKNAPAVFQRAMQSVLGDTLGVFSMVYIDDIVVYSRDEASHKDHVTRVLQLLSDYGLVLKEKKCTFHRSELRLLGYVVSGAGIRADTDKTAAIAAMPPPVDVKGVQRFLGMVNYYRQLIPNCAAIAEPLTRLTRKKEKFLWEEEQENAFQNLKAALTSHNVMAHPDIQKPFKLYTDASDVAVGAILVQLDDKQVERPVHYVSRCFRGSEKAWSTIEKEAYAIVYALTKLRPYLFGAKFVIYTDHKPLKALFLSEVKNTKVQRWSSLIAEYAAPIEHYRGKLNVRADMLSRIPNHADDPMEITEIAEDAGWLDATANPADSLPWLQDDLNREEVGARQREMPEWDRAGEENSQYEIVGNLLWSTRDLTLEQPFPRLVLPEQYRERVAKRCHREVGHQSVEKTLRRARELYTWRGQRPTVKYVCRHCPICQSNSDRVERPPPTGMPTANYPGEIVGIDTVGPLTVGEDGNRYLITLIDHATGWAEAYPSRDRNAEAVIRVLERDYIPRHGPPAIVIHDNGKEFVNRAFLNYCEAWGIETRRTSIYHPETNGKVERFHRTLKNILRKLVNNQNNQWEKHLGSALLGHRQTVSDTTGYSPAFLHYGRRLGYPLMSRGTECSDPRVLGNRLEVVADALHQAAQNTSASKRAYMEKAQKRANAPGLQIGDKVITKAHERIPFDSKWDLPKEVTRIRGPVVWCRPITGMGVIKSYNRNQLKKVTAGPDWRDVRPRVARRQRAQVFAQPTGSDVTIHQTQAGQQVPRAPTVVDPPSPDAEPSTSCAPPGNDNRNSEPMIIVPPHGYNLRRRRAQSTDEATGHKRQRWTAFN